MPIIDNPSLIKCPPDTIIWRYIDLRKFELLLKDKSLFLCRADKFSDPYEGSLPKEESEYRIRDQKRIAGLFNQTITEEEAKEGAEILATYQKKLCRSFVVNCWHMNTTESDAMWQLYLKTNEGLAIQTTYQKLHDSLSHNTEEIFLSKVRYINYETGIWRHDTEYPINEYFAYTPIIHKRLAFTHERELRVFQEIHDATSNETYWDTQPIKIGKNLPVTLETLVDKIILPPTAGKDVEQKVKDILNKYKLTFDIEPSRLNGVPVY